MAGFSGTGRTGVTTVCCVILTLGTCALFVQGVDFGFDNNQYGDSTDPKLRGYCDLFNNACPEWVDGIQGAAIHFDGKNDVVTLGSPALYGAREGSFSLGMWIRLDDDSRDAYDTVSMLVGGPMKISIAQRRVSVLLTDNEDDTLTAVGHVLPTGSWVHLTVIYQTPQQDLVKGDLRIYFDYDTLIAQGDSAPMPNLAVPFTLGAWVDTASGSVSNVLSGAMDEFRFVDHATPLEDIPEVIRLLYEHPKAVDTQVAAYGPGNKDCVSPDWRNDEVEFDAKFTCACPIYREGKNCESLKANTATHHYDLLNSFDDTGLNPINGVCAAGRCPEFVSGKQGAWFNGSHYLRLAKGEDLGIEGTSFSVAAWVYADYQVDRDLPILGGEKLHLILRGRRAYFGFYNNDFASDVPFLPNKWNHVVFSYNHKSGTMKVYINGEEEIDTDVIHPPLIQRPEPIYIGAHTFREKWDTYIGGIRSLSIFPFPLYQDDVNAIIASTQVPVSDKCKNFGFEDINGDCVCTETGYGGPTCEIVPNPIAKYSFANGLDEDDGAFISRQTADYPFPPTVKLENVGNLKTAVEFNGTTSFTLANSTELELVDSSFTVLAWVKPTNGNKYVRGDLTILSTPILKREAYTNLHLTLRSGKVYVGFWARDFRSTALAPLNEWSHVGFSYNAATGAQSVFLNGFGETGDAGRYPFVGESPIAAGMWRGNDGFVGQMADLRIYNAALHEEDVRNVYNAAGLGDYYAPGNGPNGKECFYEGEPEPTSPDSYTCNCIYSTGTNCESPKFEWESGKQDYWSTFCEEDTTCPTSNENLGFDSSAMVFDRRGEQYLTLLTADQMMLNENSFTVSAWIWPDYQGEQNDFPILGTDDTDPNLGLHLTLRKQRLHFGFYNNDFANPDAIVRDRTWSHVAFRYSAVKGLMTVTVNGNIYSDLYSRLPFQGTGEVLIGKWGGDRYFRGAIANVRVQSVAVSDGELQSLYEDSIPDPFVVANGPNGFGCGEGEIVDEVPFDSKYTCKCGLRIGENCDDIGPTGAYLFDKTYDNEAKPGDSGTCDSVTCPTFGNYISEDARALEFDGINDVLTLGSNVEDLGISDNDFSVSAWVKVTYAGDQDETILGSSDGRGLHLVLRKENVHMGFFGNDLASNLQVPENVWTHVAFVYSKTLRTQFVYMNGQSQIRGGANPFVGSGDAILGNWGSGRKAFYNGLLANVYIYPTALSRGEIFEEYSTTLPNEKFPSLGPNGLPCLNGGVLSTADNGDLVCDCTDLFKGDNCQLEIDEVDPCENVACNNPPGQCFKAEGFCVRGNCTYSWKSEGESCNDGSIHTIQDFCSLGECTGNLEFPDLVAYWNFDDIEGNQVDDSGRFEVDGTLNGLERGNQVRGRIGLGFESNVNGNTKQAMDIPDFPERYEGDFTLSCWVKPAEGSTQEVDPQANQGVDGTQGQKYLIGPKIYSGGEIAGVGISCASNGVSVYEHAPSYMPSLLTYSGAVSTTKWTHLAVVYDNYQPTLYLNGIRKKMGIKSTKLSSFSGGTKLGSYVYGDYEGAFDECRVHSKALEPSEIAEMITEDQLEDPVNYWKFDEGRGVVAQDSSVNGDDGSLTASMKDNWIRGRNNGALQFTSGDIVTIPSSAYEVDEDFTFCLWAKPDAGQMINVLSETNKGVEGLKRDEKGNRQRYAIYPTQGDNNIGKGAAGTGISIGTNGVGVFEHAAYYLPPVLFLEKEISGWTHFCVVYTDNLSSLYINGVFAKKSSITPTKQVYFKGAVIGGGRWGSFVGGLDDILVYARSLTPVEVARTYLETLQEDPVAQYRFDDDLADDSLNDNPLVGADPNFEEGIVNDAIKFTGTNTVQTTDLMPVLSDDFSIVFWGRPGMTHQIDPQRASGTQGLAGQAWVLFPNQAAGLIDAQHAGIGISLGTNGISIYEHTSSHMPAVLVWEGEITQYTQFAITFIGGLSHLYINGRYIKDGVKSVKTPVLAGKLTFGARPGNTWGYNGDIDEFRVFGRILSSTDVSEIFNNDLFRILCPDQFDAPHSISDCEENYGGAVCEGKCEPGYQDTVLSYVCDTPTRSWKNLNDTITCMPCTAGTRDVRSNGVCVPCGMGTFSPDEASVGACPMCQPGSVDADADPTTECHSCDAGSYQDEAGKRTCKEVTECPPGFEFVSDATEASNTECHACPRGSVKLGTGNEKCRLATPCADDEYEVVEPSTSTDRVCQKCPDGTIKGDSGCEDVKECRAGTYQTAASTSTSHPECDFCAVGTVDDDQSPTTQCKACPADIGSFIPEGEYGDCEDYICERGFVDHDNDKGTLCVKCNGQTLYQDEEGMFQCKQVTQCEAGRIVRHPPTATSDRICENCPPGMFVPDGETECRTIKTCVAGEYEKTAPTTSTDRICGMCDGVDFFSSSEGQGECSEITKCRAGEEQTTRPTPSSDRICSPCQPQTYKPTSGSQQCVQCTASCSPGQYLVPCGEDTSGLTLDAQCLACPQQTYKEGTNGDTECQQQVSKCDEGMFLSDSGSLTERATCQMCTSCGDDEYKTGGCDGIDDTKCAKCLTISDCQSDEFIDGVCSASSNTQCRQCPSDCTACVDVDVCTGCKAPLFLQDGECKSDCDPGSFKATASSTCENCDETCSKCSGASNSECLTCVSGRYLLDGMCRTSCGDGYYADESLKACLKCTTTCPAGHFKEAECSEFADTKCTAFTVCDRDSFALVEGTSTADRQCQTCKSCEVGQAQSQVCTATRDTVCQLCDGNSYQDEAGQISCKNVAVCQPGTYQEVAATTTSDKICSPCETGKYQADRDQTECRSGTVCPAGTYQARAPTSVTDTVCVDCIPQITYQNEEGKTSCKSTRNCAGLLMTREATKTRDRTCILHFSCPPTTYETEPPTLTSNRKCTAKKLCDPLLEFETSPGSTTEDRTCQLLTVCKSGWQQKTPPSVSSDRTCESKYDIAFPGDFADTFPDEVAKNQFKQSLENTLDALNINYDKSRVELSEGSIIASIFVQDEDSLNRLQKAVSDGVVVANYNGKTFSATSPESARSQSTGGGSSKVPIIAGAAAGLVVLVALIAFFIVRRKRSSSTNNAAPELYSPSHVSFNNPLYDDDAKKTESTADLQEDGGVYSEPGYNEPKAFDEATYEQATDGYMDVTAAGGPLYDSATDGYMDVHASEETGYLDMDPADESTDGYMDVNPTE